MEEERVQVWMEDDTIRWMTKDEKRLRVEAEARRARQVFFKQYGYWPEQGFDKPLT